MTVLKLLTAKIAKNGRVGREEKRSENKVRIKIKIEVKVKGKRAGVPAPHELFSTWAHSKLLFEDAVVQLFASPVGCGLDEGQDYGMGMFFGRR